MEQRRICIDFYWQAEIQQCGLQRRMIITIYTLDCIYLCVYLKGNISSDAYFYPTGCCVK